MQIYIFKTKRQTKLNKKSFNLKNNRLLQASAKQILE